MSGKARHHFGRISRLVLAAAVALAVILPPATLTANAAPNERTLFLYHTHTKETGRFTYWRNGSYDRSVLRQLDVFLADWRTKEPTKMDPALFDLLWSVSQEVRATQPISIVSSYRSPKTNAMLAKRSSGVADNSLHMKGKAIDFFIKGINLTTLRETVMRHQVGGIGYYPTSGSPFVHADTGNVRAWPRMTRAQLKKVFPDGRTLHLPTDGKPLSNEGRRYAMAQWEKCHAVPCNGAAGMPAVMVAGVDLEAPIPATRPRTLMATVFGDADGAAQQQAEIQLASIGGDPQQRVVSTLEIVAPVPAVRGSMIPGGVGENGAPIPARKSQRLVVATLYTPPAGGSTALDALDALGAPKARVLMTPLDNIVTAYAGDQDPEAERALRMIIERETTASLPKAAAQPALDASVQTASIAAPGSLKGMFDLTFNALTTAKTPDSISTALADLIETRQSHPSIELRHVDLVAPELDHVNETLVHPVFMSAGHFAVMTEAEGYLDKATELGPLTGRIGFAPEPQQQPSYDRFVVGVPLLVASR